MLAFLSVGFNQEISKGLDSGRTDTDLHPRATHHLLWCLWRWRLLQGEGTPSCPHGPRGA